MTMLCSPPAMEDIMRNPDEHYRVVYITSDNQRIVSLTHQTHEKAHHLAHTFGRHAKGRFHVEDEVEADG